jgi:hypothetical protein
METAPVAGVQLPPRRSSAQACREYLKVAGKHAYHVVAMLLFHISQSQTARHHFQTIYCHKWARIKGPIAIAPLWPPIQKFALETL